jgi:hypothetical protein
MRKKLLVNQEAVFTAFLVIFLAFLAMHLFSGCSRKVYYPVTVERKTTEQVFVRDTVINTHVEYHRDSVTVPVGVDSVSVLTNPYAISRAEVSGGQLLHSLTTRPEANIEVRIQYVEKLRTDSIPVPFEVVQYVEKDMSLLHYIKLHVGGFVIAFGVVVAIVALIRLLYKKIIG